MSKELSIHTAEGWNALARKSMIKWLNDRGIEPTEENIKDFQSRLTQYGRRYLPAIFPPIVAVPDFDNRIRKGRE